jgi:hypothetical protein
MQTSNSDYRARTGVGVAFLWQVVVVAGFFALAIWLWPSGLLETPPSEFTPGYVLRAVVSVAFLSVGITSVYLVVIVPFLRGYEELNGRGRD